MMEKKDSKKFDAGRAYNGAELTDGLLDSLAAEYEDGTWSGHDGRVHAGRPRFGVEKLVSVTLKVAPSTLAAIDQIAADNDETRSEVMRQVIDRGLRVSAEAGPTSR